MMITPTGITISFAGTSSRSDDSRPVVARIFGFARGAEDRPVCREMVVPAGESVEERLAAGLYSVQLTLPSGQILQRNVKIDEDSNETYQFFEDFAPNSGFSLQEAVGRSDQTILTDAATASGNTSSGDYEETLRRSADIARQERERSVKALGPRPGVRYRVSPDQGAPTPTPPAHARLTLHTGLAPDPAAEAPEDAGGNKAEPQELRGDAALWHIPSTDQSPPSRDNRRWARIALPDDRIELASLPLPWFCAATNEFVAAEVLVDPARMEGAAATVAVRDARLAGLLAFLDRGQASAARPLLEALERENVIEQTIYDKMSNPLAACAAAYVGLAVYPTDEREQWDTWLGNCMQRFPDVPDAAIVHARRLVLRPTSAGDNALAADALRRACAAGIPFFSAGVLLLREMLVLLAADHRDLAPLADAAGRLAGRVDASQAFTVLRYAHVKADAT